CFGSVEEIPEGYRDRAIHHHNPYNTNVRANAEECARIGKELARRVNGARGPVAVLFPLQGWSENTRPGQPLYDPASDAALVDAFMALRQPHVRVEFIDANLNDPPFVDHAVSLLQEMLARD
ncbi:Tm-1-like ATP-binding domain-containing protein, partial [Alicyclobacillus sp.]|uniref:Tm-1-like ATP-binding domain-containing protein n=1 Tax=Alicyclobacillus sp. TaxID=61169 RepID=UPI0025C511E5